MSFGADGEVVPANMWLQVWKHQLKLASEEEFWRGLSGEDVRYSMPPESEPSRPLPAYLLRFLREVLHLPEDEIAALGRDGAQGLLNRYYSEDI